MRCRNAFNASRNPDRALALFSRSGRGKVAAMSIPFWKMHGAGNDFILVDDRSRKFPAGNAAFIARLCNRQRGIGSEGLLLLQSSDTADFRMRFFNPDGGEADMCGNGARCLARLAYELGAAPAKMRIQTAADLVRAEIIPAGVRLYLPEPKDWRLHLSMPWNGEQIALHFVDTGVPHAVAVVSDLATVNIPLLGAAIRRHALFAPAGTNADFIQVAGSNAISIRTYERGVEAETLACGTGVVAGTLVAVRLGLVQAPVHVATAGGDTLEVGLSPPTLAGPAEHSFRGEIAYR